jgi:hypothetical protein
MVDTEPPVAAKTLSLNTYPVSVFCGCGDRRQLSSLRSLLLGENFEMSKVNESTSIVQAKENPLTGFEALDELAAYFGDDVPEDPQEILENLLSASEH